MIDLRSIRVGVEMASSMRYFRTVDGVRVKASGTKSTNGTQNEAQITISGLKRETRDWLITETSPLIKSRKPRMATLECGRVTSGLFRVFAGDIMMAEPSSPPDVDVTLKIKTGAGANTSVVSRSTGPRGRLSEIAAMVAADLGVRLDFQASDKLVASYTYAGGVMGQVARLSEAGGVRAFLDDDRLIVQDAARPAKGRIKVLNMNSGMVGLPKVTEKGVEVQYLIDGESALGGMLRLDSKMNKAANGDYKIEQLRFDVASHEDPFFYTATCKRL